MHKLQGSVSRLIVVLSACFIATCVLAETPISDPVMGRGPSWQSVPASATDGRDFLLAWIDGRSGSPAVYATRVAADGSVLDPGGILVSGSPGTSQSPSVAWTGNAYIVVWQEDGCRFRRIAPDGRIDDTAGRILSGGCHAPRVAALGDTAFVAAFRSFGDIEIEVGVIESDGTARKVDSVFGGLFDIACTSSACRLVWESAGVVTGRRLGRDGQRLSSDRILANNAWAPTIAATEERFLLAWRERVSQCLLSRRIWAQELDAESEIGGSTREPFVVIETAKPLLVDARASSSGRAFVVTWSQEREEETPIDRRHGIRVNYVPYVPPPSIEIRARRVDGQGEPLTIAPSDVWRHAPPTIASNGFTHLGAWIEHSSRKINAVIAHGDARARIAVTRTARQQSEPHVVTCGDHLLVVWAEEQDGGRHSILARRFRFSGEPLDVRPMIVAEKVDSQHRPAAAFDGHSYLIAWNEEYRVYARRLHRDGTLGAAILALAEKDITQESPAVVGTDRGFAVLHADREKLILSAIGPASIERTAIAESRDSMMGWFDGSYALGWTGSELVAVWSDRVRVQASRWTSAGQPLSFLFPMGLRDHWPDALSIACDATDCIAAWEQYREGVSTASIGKWLALPVGEPIPGFPYFYRESSDRYRPTVVRADGEFKVISSGSGGLLYLRSVRDGFSSPESTVNDSRVELNDYAVASTPEGLVTVYSRSVSGPGFGGSRRLFLRRHEE